jgi:hypothetical protein
MNCRLPLWPCEAIVRPATSLAIGFRPAETSEPS